MKYLYNDYELLYLIKENNEYALEIMIDKYIPLIWSLIRKMKIREYECDDYFQEGLFLLYKSIYSFNDKYSKTFTRYFELVWKRRILTLMRDSYVRYDYLDNTEIIGQKTYVLEEMIYEYEIKNKMSKLNSIERQVFLYYFVDNYSIDYIASKLNLNKKKIYNIIYKLKG